MRDAESNELCLVQRHVLGEDDLSGGRRFQEILVKAREGCLQALDELLARRELRRPEWHTFWRRIGHDAIAGCLGAAFLYSLDHQPKHIGSGRRHEGIGCRGIVTPDCDIDHMML